jgi:tetratricopeptide (TPR) repeat protein
MRHLDRYGLQISTKSEVAAAAYRDGIDSILAAWPNALPLIDCAIAADPEFALAYAAKARSLQILGRMSESQNNMAKALEFSETATQREQAHIHVIALLLSGARDKALLAVMEHINIFPRDAIVLSLALGAFGLLAFSGRADHDQARVSLCESVQRSYADDWWFLGHHGWCLTEAGDPSTGRTLTEKSLSLKWENGNAAHAMTHALFEQGNAQEGILFIQRWIPIYDDGAILKAHIIWHQALCEIERGNDTEACELYKRHLAPAVSNAPLLNRLTDAASLLWRFHLAGRPQLEGQWAAVNELGLANFPQAGSHFADLHIGMGLAATASDAVQEDRETAIGQLQTEGLYPQADVVMAVNRAFGAYAAGEFSKAVSQLEPLLGDFVRLGGSHAQRQICEDTFITACMKAGCGHRALPLLHERQARRESASDRALLSSIDA